MFWEKKSTLFLGTLFIAGLLIGCAQKEDTMQQGTEPEVNQTEEYFQTEETVQTQHDTQVDETVLANEYRIAIGLADEIEVEAGTEQLTKEIFFASAVQDNLEGAENADNADNIETLDTPDDAQDAEASAAVTSEQPAVEILTTLTEEQLCAVGETYPVQLQCGDYVYEVSVHIIDTTAPVIQGCSDMYITIGDSISYKRNISVTDNSGEDIAVEVNSDEVRLTEVGTYTVYYTAVDSSGNKAVQTASITVSALPVIDEAYIGPMADEVIASVITPEMTQWDQAYALFYWVKYNVTYTAERGDTSSIWTGAYEGLHNRRGDCFAFYATYSVLLTRVGIPNMCVERVDGDTNHYWNLVDVGYGWYHCDSSPRNKKHPYICFMQTDAQLAAYMETIPERANYYKFDTSLYPERGTEILFGN